MIEYVIALVTMIAVSSIVYYVVKGAKEKARRSSELVASEYP